MAPPTPFGDGTNNPGKDLRNEPESLLALEAV